MADEIKSMGLDEFKATRPDLVEKLTAEKEAAHKEALAATVKSERERAAKIVHDAIAFKMPEEAEKLVGGDLSLAEAGLKLKDAKIAALEAAAPQAPGPDAEPATGGGGGDTLTDEQRWEKDPKVREEFGDDEAGKKAFLAYRQAEKAGRVRLYKGEKLPD